MGIVNHFPAGSSVPKVPCFFIGNYYITCLVWADEIITGVQQVCSSSIDADKPPETIPYGVGFKGNSESYQGTYFVKVLSARPTTVGAKGALDFGAGALNYAKIYAADLVVGSIYKVVYIKENSSYHFYIYNPDGTLLTMATPSSQVSANTIYFIARIRIS